MKEWIFPTIAIGISVLTFISSQVAVARAAKAENVKHLEEKFSESEGRREALQKEVDELRKNVNDLQIENLELRKKLTKLENGG